MFYVWFCLILYHNTINNDYMWYYNCSTWFLDIIILTCWCSDDRLSQAQSHIISIVVIYFIKFLVSFDGLVFCYIGVKGNKTWKLKYDWKPLETLKHWVSKIKVVDFNFEKFLYQTVSIKYFSNYSFATKMSHLKGSV